MQGPVLIQVAPLVPLQGTLTYSMSPEHVETMRRGSRVLVPLGRKRVVGVVVKIGVKPDPGLRASIKPIVDLLDPEPVLHEELLDLLLWMAGYYMAPVGETIRLALPAALIAREQQMVRLTDEGTRVLSAQQAVLRSANDDLDPKEQDLLQLLDRGGGSLSVRRVQAAGGTGRVLTRLIDRGLVAQSVRRTGKGGFRTDLLLELCEPVDLAAFGRASRQLALIEALRRAGGRCRLTELKGRPPDARRVAHVLAQKGSLRVEEVEIPRDPFAAEPVEIERPLTLTAEQQAALESLDRSAAGQKVFSAHLLHGVTGSGKTEVYLQLIARVLDRGGDAIVLVPEISLTPQLAARFRARFGNMVAVLHSGLTDAERYSQWRLIRSSQVRIVVGARSAIFAPLANPEVVIVDEEHDPSFKQEEGVRYHARDVALMRAKRAGAVALLGSATPSLESYHGVMQGRLQLLRLPHRVTPRPLPSVEVVDLRVFRTGPEGFVSAPLSSALGEVLDRGEQAILFLNRRGFSTFVLCRACGHVFRCQHCSVTLTYHRSQAKIICHYCGFARNLPSDCPACHSEAIGMMGLGTEQVEHHLRDRFPRARVSRLDRDTATGKGLRSILARVGRREVDILVGTQMVTKGHDFPHVTLVGVICADLGLHFPDFRAAERTFQLMTQVAGRAGRGQRSGRVIIQTYSPEHPSLRCAQTHDYETFFAHELEVRKELSYPPWGYLAAIRFDGKDPLSVQQAATRLASKGRRLLRSRDPVVLLGPTEAPIQKLKGRTRWLLLLKGSKREDLRRVLQGLEAEAAAVRSGVRISFDVDPLMML